MKVTIKPSKLKGRVCAPPSKSMAHRLLICAGLSDGVSNISNVAESEDILATLSCLKALGADIKETKDADEEYKTLQLRGINPTQAEEAVLPCNESGSTLRFFIPIAALSDKEVLLTGSETLMNRPLTVYEDIFKEQELKFEKSKSELRIKGRLKGGAFKIAADISSQFISGLLFSLPLCEEDSTIELSGAIESKPYIDMTIEALSRFGIKIEWESESTLRIEGGQTYRTSDERVEGDWSNAAYLMTLGAEVKGLDENSLQGDKACTGFFKLLEEGCAELDIADTPDLAPALMAYAAMNHGCILRGTRRLKIKESDRGAAMQEELKKLGVETKLSENSIVVGCGISKPNEAFSGHDDHRIVMALAALCTKTGGVIEGAEAVAKSFPDYFEKISELGVRMNKEN